MAQEEQDSKAAPASDADRALPQDLEGALAKIAELERKFGTVVNDKKKAQEARDKLAERLKTYSGLEEAGYTREQIEAALTKQQDAELDKARKEGEIDKLLDNQRKKHEREVAAIDARYQAEKKINDEVLIDSVLRAELAQICEPKLISGAFSILRSKVKMIEDPEAAYGRQSVVEVADEFMSVADYIKRWAESEDAEAYLKHSMAGGGGAGGGRSLAVLRLKARKEMTNSEKSSYIRAHGLAEYMKLPMDRAS